MIKYILFLFLICIALNACAVQRVSLKVSVVDDTGNAVEGVVVRGYFFQDQVVEEKIESTHKGVSDSAGFVEVSGNEDLYVDLEASKNDYYTTRQRVVVRNKSQDVITLLLRKKLNPIPLHAKKVTLDFSDRKKKYGFDLFVGDFVRDGHKGLHSDVVFSVERALFENDMYTHTVVMRFPNYGDGAAIANPRQGWSNSDFRSSYKAPLNGYNKSLMLKQTRDIGGRDQTNLKMPLYLKIRSKPVGNDNTTKAYYCKIWPGIELFGALSSKTSLRMTYYCNPKVNDTNIEFDINRNLFKGLGSEEMVVAP